MKKIVIIEDQQVIASIYRIKFAAEGWEVEVASDGEAGLELIKNTRPDLVLLDWRLPKLNGIEVLEKLRATPGFETFPIILLSSSSLSPMVQDALKAGATMVLSKTTHSPNEIVAAVRGAISVTDEAKSL